MASVLGLLEAREVAARERVEDLREAAARAAAALEVAEIELDRRVIAREELTLALAVSAAESGEAADRVEEVVPAPVPLPGTPVPAWQEGLPSTVLALGLPAGPGHAGGPAGPGAGAGQGHRGVAGAGDDTGEGRGGAVEGEAPGGARVAGPGGVGDVQRRPAARGRVRRRPIRVIIEMRIIASLVAVRVS